MRIFVLTVVALALATPASAATHWTMTESQAESFVARHVVYRDVQAIGEAEATLEDAQQNLDRAQSTGSPSAISSALDQVASAQSRYNAERAGYGATRVGCRGDSPSSDAYHFWRFRCNALFVNRKSGVAAGWGSGIVKVVGRNRATWTWQ